MPSFLSFSLFPSPPLSLFLPSSLSLYFPSSLPRFFHYSFLPFALSLPILFLPPSLPPATSNAASAPPPPTPPPPPAQNNRSLITRTELSGGIGGKYLHVITSACCYFKALASVALGTTRPPNDPCMHLAISYLQYLSTFQLQTLRLKLFNLSTILSTYTYIRRGPLDSIHQPSTSDTNLKLQILLDVTINTDGIQCITYGIHSIIDCNGILVSHSFRQTGREPNI